MLVLTGFSVAPANMGKSILLIGMTHRGASQSQVPGGWWRHLPSGLVPSNIVDDGSCSYISNDWNISAGSAQLSSAAKRHRWTGHDNDDFQNNRKYQSHCLKCNQNCWFPEQPPNPYSQPTMAIIDVDLSIVGRTFCFWKKNQQFLSLSKKQLWDFQFVWKW